MLASVQHFLIALFGFLIILGPLVVVHEYGHYLFARLFKVKAEVFSIGFGPRLWKRQCGETEVRISAIPLGGFVKLLGEDRDSELSAEEQKRALHKQAPWKRFFIFFGGPLFNFLFAIVIFMAILLIGEPQISSVVGRAVQGSAAAKAGFQSGDQILSVNGQPVRKFEEVISVISDNPGRTIKFEVKHPHAAKTVVLSVKPNIQNGFSVYGESTDVGEIDGLLPAARSTLVGVSNPTSLAARAGLHTRDQIVEFNHQAVSSWEEIEDLYHGAPAGQPIALKVKDIVTGAPRDVSLRSHGRTDGTVSGDLGLYSSELFIEKTIPGSPAEGAGILGGDRLLAVGDQKVQSFFELKDAVQRAGEKDGKILLKWEHEGKTLSATVTPTATSSRDALLKKTIQFTVGVAPMLVMAEPATFIERTWNPFLLLGKATERMVVFSWRNLVSVLKMFTGEVSTATLGGPIMIGKIAGESLSHGLIAFLTTMAILSVGLGVLNVLPIPVLDGGHIALLAIESIRGKPLRMRHMEIIQQVGLFLILFLMVIVIKNDLTRSFFQ